MDDVCLMSRSLLGSHGRDLDGESKVLQTVDQAQNVLAFGALVEVVCAQILVEGAVVKHVVGGGEDGSGDGDDGLLGATSGAQAEELRLEAASFFAGGRPGALDQCGLEPGGAFSYAVGASFSGALVVFGAESGPGDQLGLGGEAAHVDAD